MTTTTMLSGECACGAPVIRPRVDGRFAEFANRIPFVCTACQEQADELDRHRQRDLEHDAKVRRAQARLHESGLPDRLAGLDVRCGPDLPLAIEAREWLDRLDEDDGARRGLLLTGPVGVGKTHTAASVAGAMLTSGRPVRWLFTPLMFARLGSGLGTPERDRVLAALTSRHPLFVDDLDKARPTDYAAEHVFLAIDTRITNGTPLVITTNLSVRELADRWPSPFGEGIASRLAGYCQVVRVDGHDRRMGAA